MSERCASSEHWPPLRIADAASKREHRRRPRCSSFASLRRVATSRARVLVGHSQLALAAVNGYIKTSVPPSYVPTTPSHGGCSASPAALRRCSSSPRPGCSCRRPRRRSGSPARRRRRGSAQSPGRPAPAQMRLARGATRERREAEVAEAEVAAPCTQAFSPVHRCPLTPNPTPGTPPMDLAFTARKKRRTAVKAPRARRDFATA